jgi:phosphomannomutase
MRESGALLGGEMSGHFFVKERWYGFDDACYGAARLLEIFSHRLETVSEIFEGLPDAVNTPELQIALSDEKKFQFMDRLVLEGDFSHGTSITIDGLRVEFESGWGLVRVSNTTPNLICRFEADSEHALKEIQAHFRHQMLTIDPTLEVSF